MVIGCCDSRVSPEVIFDARPGELFVVRNVANIVPPYAPDGQAHGVSAALEFGVGALRVKHIVVLGHAHCGGVKAYRRGRRAAVARRLHRQMDDADGAGGGKDRPRGELSPAEYLTRLEQANIVNSLDNLMTFPRLRKLIERGKVATARRLFRRRDRRTVGAGSRERGIQAVAAGASARCARGN